jgi:transcriptional regulator with XRE-family HTH domain
MPRKLTVEGKARMPARAVGETRRVARLLASWVEGSGMAIREIEREVGWANGALGRILEGERALRYSHVIAVLDAIGVPPVQFFAAAYPAPEDARKPFENEIVPGLTRDRLFAEIQDAVERITKKKGRGPTKKPRRPAAGKAEVR